MQNRSWVNINLKQIEENYKTYKSLIKPNQKIIAVVKANAYGHGDVEVAHSIQKLGCYDFAVSNLEEGVKLRVNGIEGNVLILGYTPINKLCDVKKYKLSQTIISSDYLLEVLNSGLKINVQFKIETGMNRLGLLPNNNTKKLIISSLKRLNVQGLFTHLATADNAKNTNFAISQIKAFESFANKFSRYNFPYLHYLNSAAGLTLNNGFSTHVRLGICLYGLSPDINFGLPNGILPCLEWKSTITMLKTIKKGESVGYGATYVANKKTLVATIPTGYADGYSRQMSNGGEVIIRGKRAKIIGRVCMDQFMVDVTDIKGVKAYDEVILIGDGYPACKMAEYLNTISYEVVCKISDRVARIFV